MFAITTHAYGYKFRSRTEARWAVAFKTAGVKFEYEKEGYELPHGRYLPDFWFPDEEMWGEVKGEKFTLEELHNANDLANVTNFPVLLLSGLPSCKMYYFIAPSSMSAINANTTLSDGTNIYVGDCIPFENYPKYGHFYHCCGNSYTSFPEPVEGHSTYDKEHPSFEIIRAALSARFEHGENSYV